MSAIDSAHDWAVSSTYLRALRQAMVAHGLSAPTDPTLARFLGELHLQSWWRGADVVRLFDHLSTTAGPSVAERLAYLASRDGMGPIVRPLASVVLALTKSPGHALFSRVQNFVTVGVRGVDAGYTPNAEGCTLTFRFPSPVGHRASHLWSGMIAVGLELARRGRVTSSSFTDREHRYELSFV